VRLTYHQQVIRALNPGRSVWIVLGMVLRTAQSIGLHRDPSNFSIPPFDAEMRRRLWWHIVSLDSRTGEDHGLTVSFTDLTTDTKLPLAVNDNALHPAMTELPSAPQNVWTEMTPIILVYMTARATQELNGLLSNPGTIPSEVSRSEIINQLKADIEVYLACCNPAIPVQRLTIKVPRMILSRMEFVSRQQWLLSTTNNNDKTWLPSQLADAFTNNETLVEACSLIEMSAEMLGDDSLHNFRWCVEMHPQYSAMLYVLWYLCAQPAAPNAARAWAAVEAAFSVAAFRLQRQNTTVLTGSYHSVWRVLGALREKAVRLRDAQCGDATEATEQTGVGNGGSGAEKVLPAMFGAFSDDPMSGDSGIVDWQSWMENFNTKD
jgi:Fungal specific transcription factor domain